MADTRLPRNAADSPPFEALQGRAGARGGLGRSANPYPLGSRQWRLWDSGWRQAAQATNTAASAP